MYVFRKIKPVSLKLSTPWEHMKNFLFLRQKEAKGAYVAGYAVPEKKNSASVLNRKRSNRN